MSNVVINIIILSVCWMLVTGAGVYVTYFEQPKEMERLEKAEKVAKLKHAEISALLAEEAVSSQRAEEIVRRWRARYKVIPKALESHETVGYLTEVSSTGFKNFDVDFDGEHATQDVNKYVFKVTGRGFYKSLYRVIWELENNRQLYRVNDLKLNHIDLITINAQTEREELQIMVSFGMEVEAYFGGAEGLSATDIPDGELGMMLNPNDGSSLPPVPSSVLPTRELAANPFFPIIMETIPPNTYSQVDIESANLVSIVGDKAVFEYKDSFHSLGVGDDVYLGQLILVDPAEGRVVARINKGGIIDEVVLELQTGERFRQALGPMSLSPTGQ